MKLFNETVRYAKNIVRGVSLYDFWVGWRISLFILFTYVINFFRGIASAGAPVFLSRGINSAMGDSTHTDNRMFEGIELLLNTQEATQESLPKRFAIGTIHKMSELFGHRVPRYTSSFTQEYTFEHTSLEFLYTWGVLVVADKFLQSVNEFIISYVKTDLSNKIIADKFLKKVHKFKLEFVESNLKSKVISSIFRLNDDTVNLLSTVTGQLIPTAFTLLFTLYYLDSIAPQSVLTVTLYALYSVAINIIHSYLSRYVNKEVSKASGDFANLLEENIQNTETIRAFNRINFHFNLERNAYLRFTSKFTKSDTIPAIFKLVLIQGIHFCMIMSTIYFFLNSTITKKDLDTLPLIINYYQMIYTSSELLGSNVLKAFQAVDDMKEFKSEYINVPESKMERSIRTEEGLLQRNRNLRSPIIEFNRVSYSSGNKTILSEVSFTINEGESCALVGTSGCGKTTIIKLLCGYYEPTRGSIKVNGVNINEVSREELRSNITVINQYTQLFKNLENSNSVLKYNVMFSYGDDEFLSRIRKGDELEDDEQEKFTQKLQNAALRLNEQMTSPSGGEQQRIGWARGWEETPIMILDEPTSAQDSITANDLIQRFNTFISKSRRTRETYSIRALLVTAHQLKTVENCDKILVINNGRISDAGNHQDLMGRSREYRAFYDSQNRAAASFRFLPPPRMETRHAARARKEMEDTNPYSWR